MSAHSSESFEQWCARVNEPISKMLSCDPRLALCMFVKIVFPALPYRFVRAGHLRASMLAHLGGLFGRGCAQENEPVSKMLSCDLRMALCTFVQLIFPALPCRFVQVGHLRESMSACSGKGVPQRMSPYQKC